MKVTFLNVILPLTLLFTFDDANAFQSSSTRSFIRTRTRSISIQSPRSLKTRLQGKKDVDDAVKKTEIVLFGLGDLRVRDHEGLSEALKNVAVNTNVLPLFVLDTQCLVNFPGASISIKDTAKMISSALESLNTELVHLNIGPLNVCTGSTSQCLKDLIGEKTVGANVSIRVCDLGAADNEIGYGAFSQVENVEFDKDKVQIKAWQCRLREDPWKEAQSKSFPTAYPDYVSKFCNNKVPISPITLPEFESQLLTNKEVIGEIPKSITIEEMISNDIYGKDNVPYEKLDSEQCTGLYGTHWGGANGARCSEADALACLESYAKCDGNDDEFLSSDWYPGKVSPNERSLEHASISWMSSQGMDTKYLLRGELAVRYLSAPLMLGCVSPRQIWHAVSDESGGILSFWKGPNPLHNMAESHEWQKVFAANCISKTKSSPQSVDVGKLKYEYWRWQGFLCRYAVSPLSEEKPDNNDDNSALVLVHGFGASGSQWGKNIEEISKCASTFDPKLAPKIAFAPDLIGFGQSEKPCVTYTQYLWESYTSDFQKEVCQTKYKTGSFVIGGNSIGGYTSMACAADDVVSYEENYISANGAPGSKSCKGLFLMNSAGQINDRNFEVGQVSVAETTVNGNLPPCSAPPFPIAKLFGDGLLWYLRPRITSICTNLYPTNTAAVDDFLCDGILRDSLDPGAINVMISGSKLPKPRTANDLLYAEFGSLIRKDSNQFQGSWRGPTIVIQGMLDPLQDSNERVSGFTSMRPGVDHIPINAGHCPHDELPEECAKALFQWLPKAFESSQFEGKAPISILKLA